MDCPQFFKDPDRTNRSSSWSEFRRSSRHTLVGGVCSGCHGDGRVAMQIQLQFFYGPSSLSKWISFLNLRAVYKTAVRLKVDVHVTLVSES